MAGKRCSKCAITKPLSEYCLHSGRWYRGTCKSCFGGETLANRDAESHNRVNQKWRAASRDTLRAEDSRKWKAGRFLNDLAKAAPCTDCGARLPSVCMDWDHRPGVDKVANVGTLVRRKPSTLFSEIAKCDLVCANCHRVRTSNRRIEVCRGR